MWSHELKPPITNKYFREDAFRPLFCFSWNFHPLLLVFIEKSSLQLLNWGELMAIFLPLIPSTFINWNPSERKSYRFFPLIYLFSHLSLTQGYLLYSLVNNPILSIFQLWPPRALLGWFLCFLTFPVFFKFPLSQSWNQPFLWGVDRARYHRGIGKCCIPKHRLQRHAQHTVIRH